MIIYGEHILVFITVLSPVWACIIWKIKTNGKEWYLIGSSVIFTATLFVAFQPIVLPKVTFWLHYYGLFALAYLFLLGMRFKFQHFNKALALAVMMLFIAGDLWEIPAFFYDYIFNHNSLVDLVWIVSHVRRVYTFAVFVLFVQLSKLRFNKYNLTLLSLTTVYTFLMLLPSLQMFPEQPSIVRISYLLAFGLFVYLGLKDESSLVGCQPLPI